MSRAARANLLAVAAAVCGIVSIVNRPFLFAPLGLVFLLVGARATSDRRFSGAAAIVLTVGAFAGTAVAAAFTKPLY